MLPWAMRNPTYAMRVPTLWPKMEVAIRVALQIWPCRLILACTVYLYNPIDPRPYGKANILASR